MKGIRIIGREVIKIYEKDDWIVEVWIVNDDFEAWIQHKDYGIKSLMFGMPAQQQSTQDFMKIVENSIDEYVEYYANEYMD